jgi:hypothetical protein
MHVHQICDRIVVDREAAVAMKASRPPRHINATPAEIAAAAASRSPRQASFLDEK